MELGRPELREHEGCPGQRVGRTAGEGGRRQGRGGKEETSVVRSRVV